MDRRRCIGTLAAAGAVTAWPHLARASTPSGPSPLVIGMSAPFHGPNGAYGLESKEAINACFAQVNASGGIHGRELQLLALDDGYVPERAAQNTHTLLETHEAFALIGYFGDDCVSAAEKIYEPAGVPLVGAVSGCDALRHPVRRCTFHVRAGVADETSAIVRELTTIGLTRIAVLHQDDSFGKSGLDGVVRGLQDHHLEPVATVPVPRLSVDLVKAAVAVAKADPQAVVIVTPYKAATVFIESMRAMGQRPRYMAVSAVGSDQLSAAMGEGARGICLSQVMPYPWDEGHAVVRDYQRAIGRGDPGMYSYSGLEGYITARLLVEGLRRAGKDPTRERLLRSLEALHPFDLGGYRISYSGDDHSGSRYVDLTVIGEGGHIRR